MIVLDTHAWLWWHADPGRLSRPALDAIDREPEVGVCTISCWELTMLNERGRISLDRDVGVWIEQALAHERGRPLALTSRIAVAAGRLGALPGDPADRIIAATSLQHGAALVTRDRDLRAAPGLPTIW